MMKIWSLGDAVVDLLPLEGMRFEACAGGAPVNVAVGVSRLGFASGFIGRVGKDPFGKFMHRTLTQFGVDTGHMEVDERYRTSTVVVTLAEKGEREFTFLVNPSADQFLTTAALPAFGADLLHYCSLALVAEQCRHTVSEAIARLHQAGGLVSFDVNLRAQQWADPQFMLSSVDAFARRADVLKLSEEEALWLTQTTTVNEALEALRAYPAALKLVTQGEKGGVALWQDKRYAYAGFLVDSIDTTGAGDAFMAGLLAGIARQGMPTAPREFAGLLTQASACGALATTHKGAVAAAPDAAMLASFIARQ